ncbi:MAG: putative Orotidine 5-phosphate decarboxylase, partial [Solirubrobacterales bacterium]|nr:putative Orotidine 5-phosphate decarboxylase [Solirubrobacterales bacterium]
MSEWPPIDEPELLRRMTMGDEEFAAFIRGVIARLAPRLYDPALLALALGYPWTRPAGSYLLSGGEVDLLADLDSGDRKGILDRFTASAGGRLPVLSIGSNAAPEVLRRKFAHLAGEEDRAVLALSGRLHDFDVGVAAQPTMYGALPATLFPSPGTAAAATLLWVTPAQFTQLAWSEITYRLGRLHSRFDVDEPARAFDEVLVFVSRFGVFCPDGEPVALAPVPATRRTAPERTQEQLLNAAALLALGPKASAETLVHAIFEEPAATVT